MIERRRVARVVCAVALMVIGGLGARPARAQEPPPPIPLFVFDLHGTVPRFPDTPALAESREMDVLELPGTGLGAQAGLHFYLVRWRALTVGLGGEVTANRSRHEPPAANPGLRGATEKFLAASPQLSFNFGSAHGWSYISGGIGVSQWSVIPDGRDEPLPADTERLKTVNYGGGARWFAKTHLAFSFDIRFYDISPGTPTEQGPGNPRAHFMVIAAGVSLK